jgi:hypothetical protein
MIPWFKCTPFELRAIVSLPPTLRKRFVAAREKQLARELDKLPDFTESEQIDLDLRGIETNLEKLCGRLLADRERQSRTKTKQSEKNSREPNVSLTLPSRDAPSLVERVERAEKKEKKTAERELPASWVPTPEHSDRATAKGLDVAEQAEAFRLHAQTHARRAANWNAAFTMWLHKATARPIAKAQTQEEWFASVGIPHHSQVRR